MRFSDIQRKEIIAASSGRFLGYVEAFVVAEPKKFMSFSGAQKDALKIPIEDIIVVGKDVILVKGLDWKIWLFIDKL